MRRATGRVAVASAAVVLASFAIAGEPALNTAHLEVPFLHQEENGCGPTSIAMVESYWSARYPGVPPPAKAALAASLPVSDDQGTLLSDMRRYFESDGYRAFTIRAFSRDLMEQIAKGRAPIVGVKRKEDADLHYVVVTGIDERKVWWNDPAKKKPGSIDRAKFEQSWRRGGGWMLLAVPGQTVAKTQPGFPDK